MAEFQTDFRNEDRAGGGNLRWITRFGTVCSGSGSQFVTVKVARGDRRSKGDQSKLAIDRERDGVGAIGESPFDMSDI